MVAALKRLGFFAACASSTMRTDVPIVLPAPMYDDEDITFRIDDATKNAA